MSTIQQYLKEIGRGKEGARPLTRAQACELMGWLLDGQAHPLQVGAFCIAMRIKGETAAEMAGFMDAVHQRLPRSSVARAPVVVLPSYNGARRLPVLTPLLALLLVREGLPVLLHGSTTESSRITSAQVLEQLGHPLSKELTTPQAGELVHLHPRALLPGLADLLDARATIGLRNPTHSLVKHINPLAASDSTSLVVGCYTHPEYSLSMEKTHAEAQSHALLLRGMEGEPVCDPRRKPALRGIVQGKKVLEISSDAGAVAQPPLLPAGLDVATTADFILGVLNGDKPIPSSIDIQVQAICELHRQLSDLPPLVQGASQ